MLSEACDQSHTFKKILLSLAAPGMIHQQLAAAQDVRGRLETRTTTSFPNSDSDTSKFIAVNRDA